MPTEIQHKLISLLGKNKVLIENVDLANYSVDHYYEFLSPRRNVRADAVVRPTSAADVSRVVKLANELKIPIVPRGAGTGYQGGAATTRGGIAMDMTGMDKIREIREDDFTATVEGGVRVKNLEETLQTRGLTLGHFPGSYQHLSVGGAISTDGTGLFLTKYGTIGETVLDLEVVMPTGEIVKGLSTYKSGLGFNLPRLFVGAEGTLGVITAATLRLSAKPEVRVIYAFGLESFRDAFDAAMKIVKRGLRILLYIVSGRLATLAPLGIEVTGALLFVGSEGVKEEVEAQLKVATQICEESGGENLGPGIGETFFDSYIGDHCYLYDMSYEERLRKGQTHGHIDFIEAVVPLSKTPEFSIFLNAVQRDYGFPEGFSIAYFYPVLLICTDANYPFDPTDEDQIGKLQRLDEAIADNVLKLGGSVTIAHGTGTRHLSRLPKAFSPDTLKTMNRIKRAVDPNNIMNPGKKFIGD